MSPASVVLIALGAFAAGVGVMAMLIVIALLLDSEQERRGCG